MADYRKVAQHFPAVRDYLRHRKWVRRGDVTAYAPGIETPSFSTDAFGFRHTIFEGERFGLGDVGRVSRYSLVLGASHVFGFGLPSNADTFASRLSEVLGHPCFGVSFPEADTRTLHATLVRILGSNARPPERVILMAGGDLTRFCYSGLCDPLFGSPDISGSRRISAAEELVAEHQRLKFFTLFWMEQFLHTVQRAGSRFVITDEPTFFEKDAPSAVEADCNLGQSAAPLDRFAIYQLVARPCIEARARFIESRLGEGSRLNRPDAYGYIDEFHYSAETIKLMAPLIL